MIKATAVREFAALSDNFLHDVGVRTEWRHVLVLRIAVIPPKFHRRHAFAFREIETNAGG